MNKIFLTLGLLISHSAWAQSGDPTRLTCFSPNPSLNKVDIQEIQAPQRDGEIFWKYEASIHWYDAQKDELNTEILSSVESPERALTKGTIGYKVFGDFKKASHGVLPGAVLIAKDKEERIQLSARGNVYFLKCE